MKADDIRRVYLEYMTETGHVVIPRAPLIPHDDPTTLFTGSGMQPLVPYLLGADHPAGTRVADSQTCLRVQDIDEVGDNRHTTFFEMLGNWSLGDYFKQEQLPQVWTFLTEKVGLDPNRIYVSCFIGDPAHGIPKDTESAEIWTRLFTEAGVSADQVEVGTEEHGAEVGTDGARIAFYGKKNWWCRGGDAEYDAGRRARRTRQRAVLPLPARSSTTRRGARNCHQNCDCGRFIEIGNSVFMEYQRTETGFAPLPRKNVDYGGGLARIAAASIDTSDVFRINLLWPIIEKLAGPVRQDLRGRDRRHAGHRRPPARRDVPRRRRRPARATRPRATSCAGSSGGRSGMRSTSAWRRTSSRRSSRRSPASTTSDYPEVGEHADYVVAVLSRRSRPSAGPCARASSSCAATARRGVTGAELFVLYDTFGFPVELSTEEAQRAGHRRQRVLARGVRRADGRAAGPLAEGHQAGGLAGSEPTR